MNQESLLKSIDALIDSLMKAEDPAYDGLLDQPKESKAKNPQTPEAAKPKADEVMAELSKPPTEKEGENGRPKSDHDMNEEQGNEDEEDVGQGKKTKEAKGYDHVQREQSIPGPETTKAPSVPESMAKAITISKEDYEILKAAKSARKDEELRKARKENEDLIKAVVASETKKLAEDNQKLTKKLEEAVGLLKSLGKRPLPQKGVTSVAALEKSFGKNDPSQGRGEEEFSKSEKLDAAERLVKARMIPMETVIELENTGFIYNPKQREMVEKELLSPGSIVKR